MSRRGPVLTWIRHWLGAGSDRVRARDRRPVVHVHGSRYAGNRVTASLEYDPPDQPETKQSAARNGHDTSRPHTRPRRRFDGDRRLNRIVDLVRIRAPERRAGGGG